MVQRPIFERLEVGAVTAIFVYCHAADGPIQEHCFRVTEYFQDYITVFAYLAFGVILALLLLSLASLIRPSRPTPTKSMSYESGIDPVGGGWSQTHIRYYVFALLFLIFDVEAVFIFPWAIRLEELGWFGLWEMLVFIGILVLGLLYAIRKGVLKWE